MRAPLSWLRRHTDLGPDVGPEQVAAALVRVGLEEEGIHRVDITGPVVVGEVLSAEPEPQSNGKTILWCQVRVGAGNGPDDVRGIVCGASTPLPPRRTGCSGCCCSAACGRSRLPSTSPTT